MHPRTRSRLHEASVTLPDSRIAAYDALFYGRELPARPVCGDGTTKSAQPHIYQHQASLIWDSPCHCWRAGFTAMLNECDKFPTFHLVVDLSALAGGALPH